MMSEIKIGVKDLVKYPFLNETGEYMQKSGITLYDLGNTDYLPIIEKAYGRIIVNCSGQSYQLTDTAGPEILSFVISVMLLKIVNSQQLIRKFSLGEARRIEKHLAHDMTEDPVIPVKILQELFGVGVGKESWDAREEFTIKIPDYLKHAIHFHEKEWKLVNRRVHNGKVFLSAHEAARLVRNEVSNLLIKKIQIAPTPKIPDTFQKFVDDLMTFSKQFVYDKPIDMGDLPPCVQHAMGILNRGENLPHSGRFLLATFFLYKGKPVSEIVPLFKTAPDYSEKITTYQLENVRTKGYKVSSCDKLRSENLCFATSDCHGLINPVHFRKK